jgi:hypothetical protein
VVDLSTGAYTLRGNSGGPAISGLGGYQGGIYAGAYVFGPQPNALYQINPTNGSMTLIGVSTEPYMDIGSTTNGLYKFGYNGNLYSINVTTGASTLIGATGIPVNGGYTGLTKRWCVSTATRPAVA